MIDKLAQATAEAAAELAAWSGAQRRTLLDRLADALAASGEEERVGRIIFNGVPTGVAVVDAMHHGGPWPAASNPRYTSVGTHAVDRFVRPVALQGTPSVIAPYIK